MVPLRCQNIFSHDKTGDDPKHPIIGKSSLEAIFDVVFVSWLDNLYCVKWLDDFDLDFKIANSRMCSWVGSEGKNSNPEHIIPTP